MDIRPIFQRRLPEGLEGLYDLALDLRWTGSQMTDQIWEMLDPEAWEITNNPYMILENVSRKRLEEVAQDEGFKAELDSILERKKVFLEEACWFGESCRHPSLKSVAYFSMEFGLSEALPIYSGGLGSWRETISRPPATSESRWLGWDSSISRDTSGRY